MEARRASVPSRRQSRPSSSIPIMPDSDKRQIALSLCDYIRVFCGTFKDRFLLQDIEQLVSAPVSIPTAHRDPNHARRRLLLDSLFAFFRRGNVHPLHWFDVITAWKGGHKRVLTFQEFSAGMHRFCEEMRCAHWPALDLRETFQFLQRSDIPLVRRQDFRFAMKRGSLSRRKVTWLNRQAALLHSLEHFLRKIRAKFSDFSPSQVIRHKGRTITVHELESMLYLMLTDMAIFHSCANASQLLSVHDQKIQQLRRCSQSSGSDLEDLGDGLQDDGSVGSLLSLQSIGECSRPTLFSAPLPSAIARQDKLFRLVNGSADAHDEKSAAGSSSDSESPRRARHHHRRAPTPPPVAANVLTEEQRREEETLLKKTAEKRHYQHHYSQHLHPEELQHLQTLAGSMAKRTGTAGGGQTRASTAISRESMAKERSRSILATHSILSHYSTLRSSIAAPAAQQQPVTSPAAPALDSDDESDFPVHKMISKSSSSDAAEAVDLDSLAAFEQSMEDKKSKHMKAFQSVTQHFDRRVNQARSRLNQIR